MYRQYRTDSRALIGERVLSGVWMNEMQLPEIKRAFGWTERDDFWRTWDSCQTCEFLLDGIVYVCVEDPSDGYRSHLRAIVESPKFPVNWWGVSEQVIGHHVRYHPSHWDWWPDLVSGEMKEGCPWWERDTYNRLVEAGCDFEAADLLVYVSVDTGKEVLVLGTTNVDDYYPVFTSRFHPENLSYNGCKTRQLVNIGGTPND